MAVFKTVLKIRNHQLPFAMVITKYFKHKHIKLKKGKKDETY